MIHRANFQRSRRSNIVFGLALLFLVEFILFSGLEVKAADGKDPDYVSPTEGLGAWIWHEKIQDGQVCRLQKTVEIPKGAKVERARLSVTVDNEFVLYFDGHVLGRGAEWRELFVFDLTELLTPGRHVIAVSGANSFGAAGMILGMRIWFADGKMTEIRSDSSWKIVPEDVDLTKAIPSSSDWRSASVVGILGQGPRWSIPENVYVMPVVIPAKVYFWQKGWFQITLASVCGVVILVSLRLMAQMALDRKEKLLLREERARIARDIHDDIGARMTQLVLHGEIAQQDLPEDAPARGKINSICEDARGLLSTMDEVLWAVNPQRDTLRDFTSYVCNYAQNYLSTTPIQCRFEVDAGISSAEFNLPLRRSLLMAIKETLNNAVKYSQATEICLAVKWQGERLVVVVEDNGKGFDPAKVRPGRNGLTNMAQRMKSLGGTCVITSAEGKGCRIEFGIPLMRSPKNSLGWLWNPAQLVHKNNKSDCNDSSKIHDPTRC